VTASTVLLIVFVVVVSLLLLLLLLLLLCWQRRLRFYDRHQNHHHHSSIMKSSSSPLAPPHYASPGSQLSSLISHAADYEPPHWVDVPGGQGEEEKGEREDLCGGSCSSVEKPPCNSSDCDDPPAQWGLVKRGVDVGQCCLSEKGEEEECKRGDVEGGGFLSSTPLRLLDATGGSQSSSCVRLSTLDCELIDDDDDVTTVSCKHDDVTAGPAVPRADITSRGLHGLSNAVSRYSWS